MALGGIDWTLQRVPVHGHGAVCPQNLDRMIAARRLTAGRIKMNIVSPQQLKLEVDGANAVSALLLRPSGTQACFIFAHGAGAGMTHEFMERVATGLYDRGIATLRY